jgi:hypothetical protein
MLLLREEKTFISVRFSEDEDFRRFCSSKKIDTSLIKENQFVETGPGSIRLLTKDHILIVAPSK